MSCPTTMAFSTPSERERMNADRRGLHVQTVRRNLRVSDSRQIGSDDRKFFSKHRQDGRPHARRLRVAMQQYDKWTVATGSVMQFYSVDLRGGRREGLFCRVSVSAPRKCCEEK